MSGWDAMVADETRTNAILTDHNAAFTRLEDLAWHTHGQHRFGVSYLQGYRRARRDVIGWMMHTLTRGFDALLTSEVIAELRKGENSVYYPLFIEDPVASLLCDHCRTTQLFTETGICPNCGRDMDGS